MYFSLGTIFFLILCLFDNFLASNEHLCANVTGEEQLSLCLCWLGDSAILVLILAWNCFCVKTCSDHFLSETQGFFFLTGFYNDPYKFKAQFSRKRWHFKGDQVCLPSVTQWSYIRDSSSECVVMCHLHMKTSKASYKSEVLRKEKKRKWQQRCKGLYGQVSEEVKYSSTSTPPTGISQGKLRHRFSLNILQTQLLITRYLATT